MGPRGRPQGNALTPPDNIAERVRRILVSGGVVAPESESRWILEAATGRSRASATVDPGAVDEQEAAVAIELAIRRAAGEPLQYLTGVAGFRHLELVVGPGVLIPRPETEIVAELAMSKLPHDGIVVDCGTGSGAIALSIAQERPDARVVATERSPAAMSWAEKNRAALGLDVELISCDLLDGVELDLAGEVDVVVSNPPYVPLAERRLLAPDVVDHEPHEALFAGDDGLSVIRRLATEATTWLRPGGWLVTEIGGGQAPAVRSILAGFAYDDVAIHDDLTGRARIALGRKPR